MQSESGVLFCIDLLAVSFVCESVQASNEVFVRDDCHADMEQARLEIGLVSGCGDFVFEMVEVVYERLDFVMLVLRKVEVGLFCLLLLR
jgi:hypothetical protein